MNSKKTNFYDKDVKVLASQTSTPTNHEKFIEELHNKYKYDLCVADLVELNFASKTQIWNMINNDPNFIKHRRMRNHCSFKIEDVISYLEKNRGRKYEDQ